MFRPRYKESRIWSRVVPKNGKIRFYPEFREARPNRLGWSVVRFVPQVQLWANCIMIGFNKSQDNAWNPVLCRPYLNLSRFGWSIHR